LAEFGPRDAAMAEAQRLAMEQQRRDNPLSAEVPSAGQGDTPIAAAAPADVNGEVPTVAAPVADANAPVVQAASATRVINVRTDVLDVDISLRGADLVRADLPLYPVEKGKAEVVRLLRNNG